MELPKFKNPKLEAHRSAFFKKYPEDIPAYLESVDKYLARKRRPDGSQSGGGDESWIIEPSNGLLDIIEFVWAENNFAQDTPDPNPAAIFQAANGTPPTYLLQTDTKKPPITLEGVDFKLDLSLNTIKDQIINKYFNNAESEKEQQDSIANNIIAFFHAVYGRLIFRAYENRSITRPLDPEFYRRSILYVIGVIQRINLYMQVKGIDPDLQYYYTMVEKYLPVMLNVFGSDTATTTSTPEGDNIAGTKITYGLQRIPYQVEKNKQNSHYVFTHREEDYGANPIKDVDMWLSYIFMGDDPERKQHLIGKNEIDLRTEINSAANMATIKRMSAEQPAPQKGGYAVQGEPLVPNPTQPPSTAEQAPPTVENPPNPTTEQNTTIPTAEQEPLISNVGLGMPPSVPKTLLEVPSDVVRFTYLDRANFYKQIDDVPMENIHDVNVHICIVSADNSCKLNGTPVPFLKYIMTLSVDSTEYEFPKFQYSMVDQENDAAFRSGLFVKLLDTLKLNICLESAQQCMTSQQWTESSEMKTLTAFDDMFNGLVLFGTDNLLAVFNYDKIMANVRSAEKQPDTQTQTPQIFEYQTPEMYPITDDKKSGLCWGIVDELIFEKKIRGKPVSANVVAGLRTNDSLWLVTDTIASKWAEFPFSVYFVIEGEDGKYKSDVISQDSAISQQMESVVGSKVEHSLSQKYGDRYCFTLNPVGGVDMENARRYAVFMWSATYLTKESNEEETKEPNEEEESINEGIEPLTLPTIYFVENTEKTGNVDTIIWGVQKISQIARL